MLRSEGRNFTWEKRIKVALETILALRYLHSVKKMVYRNLKTRNILVMFGERGAFVLNL